MNNKILAGIFVGTAVIVLIVLVIIRVQRMDSVLPEERVLVNAMLTEAEKFEGQTFLIPHEEIYDSGLKAEDVPPLNDPAFTGIAAMDTLLGDDLFGIDVEVDGMHRFYPYQILNWHRVVNDTFNEKKLAITYDPLTGAAIVYDRLLPDGGLQLFDFSGSVYNNGMLLADPTDGLWWQMNGTAVVGSRAGVIMKQYPSQSMRWKDWKKIFPDGEVLSSETGYARDYTRHPYGEYASTKNVYFPLNHTDGRIGGSKWAVDGVSINGEQLAISKLLMQGSYAYNTILGGMPIAAFYDTELDMVHVFDSRVDDRALTFSYDGGESVFVDDETGSTWVASGLAVQGELKGTVLRFINAPEYYWFAWAAAYPDTRVAVLDEQKAEEAAALENAAAEAEAIAE